MPHIELVFESGKDPLSVRHFELFEEQDGLFTASIRASSPRASIDTAAIVGRGLEIRLTDGVRERRLSGICRGMELLHTVAKGRGESIVQLELVPRLWMLTRRESDRVFEGLSAPEIVKELLEEAAIEARWEIDEARHAPLGIRSPRGASVYEFVRRLLTEAAIGFEFEGTQVVFRDTPSGRVRTIVFKETPSEDTEEAFVSEVRIAYPLDGETVVRFSTNVVDLSPGVVFSIEDHPAPDLAGERLLVVASRTEAEVAEEGEIIGGWQLSGQAVFARVAEASRRKRAMEEGGRDLHTLVEKDEERTVGRNRTKVVENDESATVGQNRTALVGGNEQVSIGGNQSVTVGMNRVAEVGFRDSTLVGERHAVMVLSRDAPTYTQIVCEEGKIKVATPNDAASIELEGDTIALKASRIELDRQSAHKPSSRIRVRGGLRIRARRRGSRGAL